MRMIRSNITLYFERKNCSKPGSDEKLCKIFRNYNEYQ